MVKLKIFTFFLGLAVAIILYGSSVMAQTNTPVPTEVVPTSAPSTGRG